jgi:hypothetical protein
LITDRLTFNRLNDNPNPAIDVRVVGGLNRAAPFGVCDMSLALIWNPR